MKSLNKIWGIGLLVMLLSLVVPGKSMAQGGYISDQEFYDQLGPYGTWVSDPDYGEVWVPDVDGDFRPYATRGHWVVTDYGNTWVSDYEWGWAPFHYGRWRYDDYYGWEWIPGHEWAPAWVCWRHGDGYYGWAPLRPGISISISIGGGYDAPDYYWTCAPQAYINSPVIYNYYVPRERSVTIIHNTTVINNTYVRNNVTYISGPRVQEIRQVTHNNNVRVYNINNASRPGVASVSHNTVNIYRPAVQKSPNARPARVVDANAYRNAHPNQKIANGGGFNHTAAAHLATVAHSNTPDNKVVRVNNNRQAPNNQPVNRPAPNRPNGAQPNANPAQQRQQAQQQAQQRQQQADQQRVQQQAQQRQQTQRSQQQQAQQRAQQQQAQQVQQRQQQVQQQMQQQRQQQAQQQAQQRQQQM
ncbi:MAG: hypothetical protein JST50_05240, partial [Bacteroidetes bacterium]|nr:hypothetical protein [Bacteroidota bacterium]